MAIKTEIPKDFVEFLKLLKKHEVSYLLVGGYAVIYYGYPRPTGDMDLWIKPDRANAEKLVNVLKEFGFDTPNLSAELFSKEKSLVRLGETPFMLELITSLTGVNFDDCFRERNVVELAGAVVNLLSLSRLRENKAATGRFKDSADIEKLPLA